MKEWLWMVRWIFLLQWIENEGNEGISIIRRIREKEILIALILLTCRKEELFEQWNNDNKGKSIHSNWLEIHYLQEVNLSL